MILCVEDDRNIRDLIVYTLNGSGFEAKGCEDSAAFYKELSDMSVSPELILLDIMLPEEDGLSVLAKLKANEATKEIPVILVTARGSEYDKVTGLDAGADDYIAKPFGMMEFISRVRAVLRRTNDPKKPQKEMAVGNLMLNVQKRVVTVDQKPVALTFKEFELLRFLLSNRGIVLSRDTLLTNIWGYDFDGETRTVDVHIRTLRQKLGSAGSLIETVRGVGYRIETEESI